MGKEVETTRSDPNFKRTFCSREGEIEGYRQENGGNSSNFSKGRGTCSERARDPELGARRVRPDREGHVHSVCRVGSHGM